MDKETEEIIKEQLKILPKEVISIIADVSWIEKVLDIGKKNGLSEKQLEILQLETNLLLLGLVHPDDYPKELESHLKISDIKLDNVVNDVNRELLSSVRGKLVELFNKHYESSLAEKSGEISTNPNWMQNLDFIMSGGDYYFLTEESNNKNEVQKTDKLIGTSNILETKNKLLE